MSRGLSERARAYTTATEARARGVYPYFRALEAMDGATASYEGRPVLMFGSNDYLGLTAHPRVREAAKAALDRYGAGPSGSRHLNGSIDLHRKLEERLCEFLGRQDALVFATGFQANLGALAGVLSRHDVVLADEQAHASVIDGVRLSFARSARFAHNDAVALDAAIARCLPLPESALMVVVVESLYSMEGDTAPLDALRRVCHARDATLIVDEAHAIGVLGSGGRGETCGMAEVSLVSGTFSKALASVGGFVAGDRDVIDYIRHRARALIFSAALPAAATAAALAALECLQREPEHLAKLRENVAYAFACLRGAGLPVAGDAETWRSPILPVRVESPHAAFAAATTLLQQGVFINPIIPPAATSSLLRFTVTAAHSRTQIEHAVTLLGKVLSSPRRV